MSINAPAHTAAAFGYCEEARMELSGTLQKVPFSHCGWSIDLQQGVGHHGPETVIMQGAKDGVISHAIAWNQEIAWSSLRDMIRQREPR